MKILQFYPPQNLSGASKTGSNENLKAKHDDFSSVLNSFSASAINKQNIPDGIISLENRRAINLPSTIDLSLAGSILKNLNCETRSAKPEQLNNVHNIEGVVHIYQKRIFPSQ